MAGVIVVTGAARGMGRACVERLRSAADHLVAADLAAPDIDGHDRRGLRRVGPRGDRRARRPGPRPRAFRALVHVAGISPTMGTPRQIFAVDLVGTQLLLDAFEPLVGPGAAAVCFASSRPTRCRCSCPIPTSTPSSPTRPPMGFLDQVEERFDDSGLAYGWAKRGVVLAAERAAVAWGPRGPGRVGVTGAHRDRHGPPGDGEPAGDAGILDATPLARFGDPDHPPRWSSSSCPTRPASCPGSTSSSTVAASPASKP